MQVFRVYAHRDGAAPGTPGHATYVYPRQTTGRWDNASDYQLVYVAATPEGAIGESFGRIPEWSDAMFDVPYLPGARSALATFTLDDERALLNLDDTRNLLDRNLRPTQVVIRDTTFTQPLASRIYREQDDGDRRWAGIQWWSVWTPQWPVSAVWCSPQESHPLQLESVEPLTVNHPAVHAAAATLVRLFVQESGA